MENEERSEKLPPAPEGAGEGRADQPEHLERSPGSLGAGNVEEGRCTFQVPASIASPAKRALAFGVSNPEAG
jgi:hypothetical protein